MTKQEKIVISAYTGYLLCDFDDLHKYIEKLLGRPVWTHELAGRSTQEEIRKLAKPDLDEICKDRQKIYTFNEKELADLTSDKVLEYTDIDETVLFMSEDRYAKDYLGKEKIN